MVPGPISETLTQDACALGANSRTIEEAVFAVIGDLVRRGAEADIEMVERLRQLEPDIAAIQQTVHLITRKCPVSYVELLFSIVKAKKCGVPEASPVPAQVPASSSSSSAAAASTPASSPSATLVAPLD